MGTVVHSLLLALGGRRRRGPKKKKQTEKKKGIFPMVGPREIFVDFVGGSKQYAFIAALCKLWLEVYGLERQGTESERNLRRNEGAEGKGPSTTTVESQILMSIPRATETLAGGWCGSNGALKLFAGAGELEMVKLCRPRGVEWGSGMFAAARCR